MELFREWIITIISIIILVTFIEILLPDSNHRRYVGVVIGLLIMLVILEPLLGFVEDGGSLGEGILAASNQIEQRTLQNRIQQQQYSNNDIIIDIYKQDIGQQMAKRLEEKLGVFVHDIVLEIEEEDMDNFGSIKGIYVVLTENKGELRSKGIDVQEVSVNVSISSNSNNNLEAGSILIGSRGEAVIEELSSFYQVSRENISVTLLKTTN